MIKFFRYSGSKTRYSKLINSYIDTKSNIYVEPFVGSGAILFNLDREFDQYIINDLDRNIIRIYKTFQKIDYSYYKEHVKNIFNRFGEFVTDQRFATKETNDKSKASFYAFRDWFNENHWKTETIEEGIYLHMLANSVINSFLRFGPNGMNNSFGLRFYELSEQSFNHVQSILNKTTILNCDYKEVFEKYSNAFYFLDPPYFSQSSSYEGFSENEFKIFLNKIKNKDFLYTDILNEYNIQFKNKMLIREMNSTSPLTNKFKNGNMEYLFSSKKLQTQLDNW